MLTLTFLDSCCLLFPVVTGLILHWLADSNAFSLVPETDLKIYTQTWIYLFSFL